MSEWTRAMTRQSKFLSLVLRHSPELAGITLDDAGWANIDEMLIGAGRAGVSITRDELVAIVAHNPKQRFLLDDTQTRIRAAQGHSLDVALGYVAAQPPAVLFHGTHQRVVSAILAAGLKPMGRQQVHLSADEETARAVGARRGKPVILTVDAAGMHADGAPFWCATNGVWLCDTVPAERLALRNPKAE